MARVAAAMAVTARRKREIISAINSAALWLQRTPAEIPANHEYLRRAFERLNFGTLGVGRARVRNVQSLLKQGLAIAGVPPSRPNYLVPLTAVWQVLNQQIPYSYARDCLKPLMRFCGALGIHPDEVNDAVIDAFREALRSEKTTARPFIAAQSAVRLWNRMMDQVPTWPQVRLTPLLRRETTPCAGTSCRPTSWPTSSATSPSSPASTRPIPCARRVP
jgi:hypothetical protein